jgi:hypothetical protein
MVQYSGNRSMTIGTALEAVALRMASSIVNLCLTECRKHYYQMAGEENI